MIKTRMSTIQKATAGGRREAERLAWLERAEATLDTAKTIAQGARGADPALLTRHLKAMIDKSVHAVCLEQSDLQSLALRSKMIELTAYKRAFERLLIDGRAAIRGNRKDALGPLLKTATDYMAELRKRGMGPDGIAGLEEKIEILRQASRVGDSEKAKADDDNASGPKSHTQDHRTFLRYGDPSLIVELSGQRYRTVDWGLGGALLAGAERLPTSIGTLMLVKIRVEGGHVREEHATIVRSNLDKQQVALQFRRFGSSLVAIKRECESLGMVPR